MSQRTRSSETVFTGKVFSIHADRVRLPHGPETLMHVVRHPASVILIPMPDPAHIVLARQYRYAIDEWLWELPAGSVDPGETAEEAAVRECHEEIAKIPTRIERLDAWYPTPGYCDELMIFFKLTGLEAPDHPAEADEDEDIEARVFTLSEARQLVQEGGVSDMKTAFGLTLL
ncbi:MAG: NUDIX hydrolase [Vicinamibacterales bacterium]|jgi:ADP-ribose pyrophosphatase|nr:NUDIX hydrolase [Vicinamibacterales bacterium]MDP7478672.1 NUDIX hydrolase [Vicinamibacterales bacterium]HJN43767.1 NUDIX hydrolase [Vicinamibacterales bacterium]|tara:strand:+ start:183 stop:701 length:519 start_codon:yes stop_codon:yes gene_type:complete